MENKTYLWLGLGAAAAYLFLRKKAKSAISSAASNIAALSPLAPDLQLNAAEFVNYVVASSPANRVSIDSLSVMVAQPEVVFATYSDGLYTAFDLSQPNRGLIKIGGKSVYSADEMIAYFGQMPELSVVPYVEKTWTKMDLAASGLDVSSVPDDIQMRISITAQNDKSVDLRDYVVSSNGSPIDAQNITSISCIDMITETSASGLGSLGVEMFLFRLPNSQQLAAFLAGVSSV